MTKHYLSYKIPSIEFNINDIVPGSNIKICPCGKFVFVIVGKYSSSNDLITIKRSNLTDTYDLHRSEYPFEVYSFSKSKRYDNYCYTCHSHIFQEEEIIDIEITIDLNEETKGKKNKRKNHKNNKSKNHKNLHKNHKNHKNNKNKSKNNNRASVKKVTIDMENEISSNEFKKEILDYELDQIKRDRDLYYANLNNKY